MFGYVIFSTATGQVVHSHSTASGMGVPSLDHECSGAKESKSQTSMSLAGVIFGIMAHMKEAGPQLGSTFCVATPLNLLVTSLHEGSDLACAVSCAQAFGAAGATELASALVSSFHRTFGQEFEANVKSGLQVRYGKRFRSAVRDCFSRTATTVMNDMHKCIEQCVRRNVLFTVLWQPLLSECIRGGKLRDDVKAGAALRLHRFGLVDGSSDVHHRFSEQFVEQVFSVGRTAYVCSGELVFSSSVQLSNAQSLLVWSPREHMYLGIRSLPDVHSVPISSAPVCNTLDPSLMMLADPNLDVLVSLMSTEGVE